MILWIVIILIVVVVGSIYMKLIYTQQRLYQIFRSQGIAGERFVPVFGQIFSMIRASNANQGVDYFYQLSVKHGLTYLFGFGPLTRLVILNPDLLSDILGRSKANNYRKPTDLISLVKPIIGTHNLLVSENQEHERARRMLNPAFHFVNLKSMVSIMVNETQKAIDDILIKCQSNDKIDLDADLNLLTFSIIASSAFGQSLETVSNAKTILAYSFGDVKEMIAYRTLRLISQIEFLSELPFWGKTTIDRSVQRMNQFVDQVIVDRRQGRSKSLCSGEDILDLLLSAVDEQGHGFTDQQIRDEALTFILAGHETTGNLMSWIFYILMTHDDVYHACLEEINRILPNRKTPEYNDLTQLHIVEAVIYETLRLYPSAPFFVRESTNDHFIGTNDKQVFIPKQAMIVIHCYALHRREEYWTDPMKFQYQRWLRDPNSGLKPKLAHPYAYLPFAAGPRNCIGQNFALLEAKVMLTMFLQHCHFQLVPGQTVVPEMKGVTMRPKYGLLARLNKRDTSS
jgi:cytochrome P450